MVPKKTRTMIAGTVVLLSLLLPLSGCEAVRPQHPTIEGMDLERMGKEYDQKVVQDNIRRFKDKYQRHFAEGRYFADLSEAKKKLNEEYNLYLKAQMDKVFPEPYILRMEAEFVNSEVQAYAKGEKTLSEILQSPGENILSLKGQFFGFRKNPRKEPYQEEDMPEYMLFEKLAQEYVKEGVDFIEIWVNEYPQTLLEKYPLEEMNKQENLFLYLKGEPRKILSGYLMKTYYDGGYNYKLGEPPISLVRSGMTDKPYPGGREYPKHPITEEDETPEFVIRDNLYALQKKYNMEFFHITLNYYAPVAYPQMYFLSLHNYYLNNPNDPEGFDHFLGLYYQHLLNEKIRPLLEEEGLAEEVLCFVQTEPADMEFRKGMPVRTIREPYPFGKEGHTKEDFLFGGYSGWAHLNFLVLNTPQKSVDIGKVKRVIEKLDPIAGIRRRNLEQAVENPALGGRNLRIHSFLIDEYGKKVVKDLFRRHPLTERDNNPALNFRNVFADTYDIRSETEGFLYLDIFAEKTGEEIVVLKRVSDGKE
ncbi:MAG: hypothetical protein Q4A78_00390 [Peptostreptococcaceae bacterium]|nr:hypothetical protein [Peptostreptococcaceae bacterium]